MKSLICLAPGQLEYQDIPAPALTAGQAIVKIKRIGICGTDLHSYQGTQPFFSYPRILGHELSGDLIEYDQSGFKELDIKPGDSVSVIPYFNCGICIACRMGKPNCCANLKVCGVHIDGGMVEYLSVPVSSLIRSEGFSYEELALLEPLSIGAHAVKRAEVQEGEFVLIAGAGPIGLAAMEFSKLAGARVIALDLAQSRLQFCMKKQKADFTLDAHSPDLEEQLKEITRGDLPTVIMDATGNREAINNAFQYMASGGRYVLIGIQKGMIEFNHPEFHRKEATLMSSRNARREDFQQVIACIKKGWIRTSDYITHSIGFDQVSRDFPGLLDPTSGVVKAMVQMD